MNITINTLLKISTFIGVAILMQLIFGGAAAASVGIGWLFGSLFSEEGWK